MKSSNFIIFLILLIINTACDTNQKIRVYVKGTDYNNFKNFTIDNEKYRASFPCSKISQTTTSTTKGRETFPSEITEIRDCYTDNFIFEVSSKHSKEAVAEFNEIKSEHINTKDGESNKIKSVEFQVINDLRNTNIDSQKRYLRSKNKVYLIDEQNLVKFRVSCLLANNKDFCDQSFEQLNDYIEKFFSSLEVVK